MQVSRTVIISCAGMGNRLGLGTTKALVEVEGKPLIMHHLEKLKDESDIRSGRVDLIRQRCNEV